MRLVRTIALAAATGLAWPALGADAPSGGLRGLLDRGKEGIAGGVFGLQVGAFGDALCLGIRRPVAAGWTGVRPNSTWAWTSTPTCNPRRPWCGPGSRRC